MIYQILIFSVIIVAVFAGLACAIVRFTLTGKVSAKVEHRTSIKKCNYALAQSGLKPLDKSPAAPVTSSKETVVTKHSLA